MSPHPEAGAESVQSHCLYVFFFYGLSCKAPGESWQKWGGAAPEETGCCAAVFGRAVFQGRITQHLLNSAVHEARRCSVCLCKASFCPFCHLYCSWLAAVAEGHACFLPSMPHTKNTTVTVVYLGLIPVKGCLRETLISRLSICSGFLLLGALKRPRESAKNQCACI